MNSTSMAYQTKSTPIIDGISVLDPEIARRLEVYLSGNLNHSWIQASQA